METRTIEEVTERLIDYRGKTPQKSPSGVRLITAKVIKGGRILDDRAEYIAESDYDTWMRRGLPKQCDVLITTEAPLGEVAQLKTPERIALAQRVILLRGKPGVIDQSYYFYALQSPFTQAHLKSRSSGTTVSGIKQSELRKVEIPYFPLPMQRKIAHILSAYDDLIENNTRRIEILEEIARALYREWFVEFRFPGHEGVQLVESAVGPIPEGWGVGRVGDLAYQSTDPINPGRSPDEPFAHFSLPAFDEGALPSIEFGSEIKSNKYVVPNGCLLLSKLNPRIPRAWRPFPEPVPRAVASTEFLVLLPRSPFTPAFLLGLFSSDKFSSDFAGLALGTSTSHQRVKPDDLLKMDAQVPPTDLVERFTDTVEPMHELAYRLRVKNANLRQTRDLLLPKLVSGEIVVHEAAAGVEDD